MFFHNRLNVLKKHRIDYIFAYKYPQSLDNAFLGLYLCITTPEHTKNS